MVEMSGRELANTIKDMVKTEIKKGGLNLCLAVILIGNDPASEKYVSIKKRECENVGIAFQLYRFKEASKQEDVLGLIQKLNKDEKTTGIIVQLPLPNDLVPNEIIEAIDPKKDVDGLTSANMGRLIKDLPGIFPATAEGVINLLRYYQIPITGKKVAVVGQSNLVGKPLAQMLLNEEATVLVANKKTKNLKELTLESDIVISAAGAPKLIKDTMISKGAVVIDIGTTLVNGKIIGDVDFEKVSKKASFITPNPGGVGPMTVAMLLSNVLKSGLFKE